MAKNIVDNPIINSPWEEPSCYWDFSEGQPQQIESRRPAGYYFRPRTRSAGGALAEEEFVELSLVNEIRKRVKRWREKGYLGVTPTTRKLLEHWNSPERERRLFSCQREAAETIIWLLEAPQPEKQGIEIPMDVPRDLESLEKGYQALRRYACKMATASGKTLVMAMLTAWSVLNKLTYPRDRRFSDAVLVVCPNLTIKERLQVLKPTLEENYYEKFELVPSSLFPLLAQAKVMVTNWHAFLPQDDTGKKGVLKRGPESDTAFCARVLKDLSSKGNILVINDEAHHAYRPALEERGEEAEKATIWVGGLDRINAVRGINFCLDFSATPFYLRGTGYEEGAPFPWIISDFGLVDAIESGIVKIPRVPVDDNTGEPIPRYFHIWKWIMERLPSQERATARRRAKPEPVFREAEGALNTLASEWKKTFDDFQESGFHIPPAIITVCDNTDLAEIVAKHIGEGKAQMELKNKPDFEPTLRIDTKLLERAESALEGQTRQEAEMLRKKVAAVGKEGELGEQVRCVVSVGMLNEGWDAHNVTQILGLRAFTSQLLCEQVIGRGLRRTQYDDFSIPEYVDVYGVPFEVIPVKKGSVARHEELKPSTLVRALPERKHLEIRFPRVEGYIFDVRHRIKADVDSMPELEVHPEKEPTKVEVKGAVGYRIGRPDRLWPGKEVVHDRNPFYRDRRLLSTVFEITAEITSNLKPKEEDSHVRSLLFPQLLQIVWEYLEKKVIFYTPREEIALRKYLDQIIERILNALEPDTEAGEPTILPRIERFRPIGSTGEVLFRTTRPCYGTTKSHISHVVVDDRKWEHSVAFYLEQLDFVISYAKNDHLDFVIPYEFEGRQYDFRPDFLVRLQKVDGGEVKVILEVKGYETEQDRAKQAGAQRWVKAVNNHGQYEHWEFIICKEPHRIPEQLKAIASL